MTTTYASRGMRHRRSRRSLVLFLVPLVIWVGVAAVLALWWSDTTSVVGPAGWLTGAGRITGLLAGYACAVLLALMARMPLLDHSIGTDQLAASFPRAGNGRLPIAPRLHHRSRRKNPTRPCPAWNTALRRSPLWDST
jgi:hypothetical protein